MLLGYFGEATVTARVPGVKGMYARMRVCIQGWSAGDYPQSCVTVAARLIMGLRWPDPPRGDVGVSVCAVMIRRVRMAWGGSDMTGLCTSSRMVGARDGFSSR